MAVQILVDGMYLSLSLMLLVVGIALMFGIMNIVMLSYGFLFVAVTYSIWYLAEIRGWNYGVASIVSLALAIILGIAMERYVFRRYRGWLLPCLVVSIGLLMILETGLLLGVDMAGFGLEAKSVSSVFKGTVTVLGATISWERVALAVAGAIVLLAGIILIHRTKTGKAMRAVAQDPGTAAALGVNLNQMTLITMSIVSVLAGIYGILRAPIGAVTHDAGLSITLFAFVAVIVGGAGSLVGPILSVFIIGFSQALLSYYFGVSVSILGLYLMLLVVLVVRPQGLFGYHIQIR